MWSACSPTEMTSRDDTAIDGIRMPATLIGIFEGQFKLGERGGAGGGVTVLTVTVLAGAVLVSAEITTCGGVGACMAAVEITASGDVRSGGRISGAAVGAAVTPRMTAAPTIAPRTRGLTHLRVLGIFTSRGDPGSGDHHGSSPGGPN